MARDSERSKQFDERGFSIRSRDFVNSFAEDSDRDFKEENNKSLAQFSRALDDLVLWAICSDLNAKAILNFTLKKYYP